MNAANFAKMAHGDIDGLIELAFDYFNDTRRLMTGWQALLEGGNIGQLRDELHRCKGGASLFGLERLVSLIGECESPGYLEQHGFDLAAFECELSAAEHAIVSMREGAAVG